MPDGHEDVLKRTFNHAHKDGGVLKQPWEHGAAGFRLAINALFRLVVRNDAGWHRRELLGRTWRRDWVAPKIGAKNVGRNKTLVWLGTTLVSHHGLATD